MVDINWQQPEQEVEKMREEEFNLPKPSEEKPFETQNDVDYLTKQIKRLQTLMKTVHFVTVLNIIAGCVCVLTQ